MRVLVYTASICLFVFGCSLVQAQPQRALNDALSDDDEIRLVVLTDLLRKESSEKKTRWVAVDGTRNPGKALLARLKEIHPKVKAHSRCYLNRNDGDSVVDSVTGNDALLFTANKIKRLTKDRAEVTASNYEANMSSFGCKFVLVREEGRWKIESADECYIS